MNALELTGRVRSHIVDVEPACGLHVHAVAAFLGLRRAAERDGIDLVPVSGFRDFDRQLAIWNAKFSGERPMLDAAGLPLDSGSMTAADRVRAILLWSALPGASRHHWGTDIDVIDAGSTPRGHRVQLTAAEFEAGGPFEPLSKWLAEHALRFGFFRPFRGVRSGVQAEAWHISFAPLAEVARRRLSVGIMQTALAAAPVLGKDAILAQLEEIHARYVAEIDWP